MAEKRVALEEPYDPRTATFWGRFAAVPGQQERHCPTFALYETKEGEFFYVSESRTGGKRDDKPLTKDSIVRTEPIPGTHANVFADGKQAVQWLNDTLAPLKTAIGGS